IGDRGEADMRVRPHVEAPACGQHYRTHLIKEHEWPYHSALRRWQRSAHFETVSEISGARHDHAVERGVPSGPRHFRSSPSSEKLARAIPNKRRVAGWIN